MFGRNKTRRHYVERYNHRPSGRPICRFLTLTSGGSEYESHMAHEEWYVDPRAWFRGMLLTEWTSAHQKALEAWRTHYCEGFPDLLQYLDKLGLA